MVLLTYIYVENLNRMMRIVCQLRCYYSGASVHFIIVIIMTMMKMSTSSGGVASVTHFCIVFYIPPRNIMWGLKTQRQELLLFGLLLSLSASLVGTGHRGEIRSLSSFYSPSFPGKVLHKPMYPERKASGSENHFMVRTR